MFAVLPWRKPEALMFVPEAFVKLKRVATSRLVEETFPSVFWPALDWNDPPIVTLSDEEADENVIRPASMRGVPDTFAMEVLPIVNTPVDEEKVISRLELAPPPKMPKRT